MKVKNIAAVKLESALKRKIIRAAKAIKNLRKRCGFWSFLIEISDVFTAFDVPFVILFIILL